METLVMANPAWCKLSFRKTLDPSSNWGARKM